MSSSIEDNEKNVSDLPVIVVPVTSTCFKWFAFDHTIIFGYIVFWEFLKISIPSMIQVVISFQV